MPTNNTKIIIKNTKKNDKINNLFKKQKTFTNFTNFKRNNF